MSIKIHQNIPVNTYKIQEHKPSSYYFAGQKNDTFTPSFTSTKKSFFSKLFETKSPTPTKPVLRDVEVTQYARDLSVGLKEKLEVDLPPENFANILTPDEFNKLLPSFTENSFNSKPENIMSGVYVADLDYMTNFSTGKENIFDILARVKELGDTYYELHKKPFIFAITDRDSLEGIQHLIKIVAEEPETYQNIKILPAVKLSFAHEAPTSRIGFENSEMLVYGINPFDDNLINFVDKVIANRKKMVVTFIKKVNELYPEFSYNVIEFAEQNRLKYSRDYSISNLYWRAREYAETKGDTAIRSTNIPPKKILEEATSIIDELDEIYTGSNQGSKPIYGTLLDEKSDVNQSIKNVFYDFSTHKDKDTGKIVSTAENLIEEMIDCVDKNSDGKAVMALSAPYYLSHYFEKNNSKEFNNVVKFIKKLQKGSKGMLCAFESVVPSYNLDKGLDANRVEEFNNFIRKSTNLFEVGGSFADAFYRPKF